MEHDLPLTLSRCSESVGNDIDLDRGIVIIPRSHVDVLTDKHLINYKDHRVTFPSWLLNVGKVPDRAKGYSPHTVYGTAYRTARFDKWRWENCDGYSMPPTQEEAEAFTEWLAYDYGESETAKGKLQEGIQRYGKWLHHERNGDEWEFEYNFDSSGGNHQPQDSLTRKERQQIRQGKLPPPKCYTCWLI